ncbi:MAG: Xaa-Pro dipeptidase [Clostridium sp.]|jgi:Xaa-Pro dipeptidase
MHRMCVKKNIEVGLALCAADKRISLYRHPITTDNVIEDTCLLALTVRRNGLYSCISRMVSLSTPSEELLKKRDAVLAVDCACQEYTKVGSNLRGVFNKIKDVYKDNGFEEEWKNHHQGGISGYMGREEKINQDTDISIEDNMIFAYNPTVIGYRL